MIKNRMEFPGDSVSFEIEDLGPIRDSIVNFKPFLLFSGESNTGKSYTAMAAYYLFFMLNNEQLVWELTSKLFDIRKIENDLKSHKEIMVNLSKTALAGLPQNFIIVYVETKDFYGLWQKYLNHLPGIHLKYKLTQAPEEEDTSRAGIRLARTIHAREGKEVMVYHLFVNMSIINDDGLEPRV